MYMAVWGVLPHSNSIFYRIFVNYTSDFRHFPKNRRFASGGGWQNGAFVHFAVEVCRFGRRLDLPPLCPAGDVPALPPPYPAISFTFCLPCPALAERSSPAGKGVTKVISCKGLRPLHPRHLIACGTYRAFLCCTQRGRAEHSSLRHLLSLPRGRGPSQTPKFLSPGPPPWLPALLKGKPFCRFHIKP